MGSTSVACLAATHFLGGALGLSAEPDFPELASRLPVFVEPGAVEKSVLYADGREVEVATATVWRPACGSDLSQIDVAELRRVAGLARQASQAHPYRGPAQGGVAAGGAPGLDLVFNFTTPLPLGAAEAITNVEHYIEAQFSDPVTVVIDLGFLFLGPAILGQTSSVYATSTWPDTRAGLQSDMDANDTIQAFLPPGNTIPVRYNGNNGDVTNEDQVFITLANYRAAIGTVSGTAAFMTFNTFYNWDYSPPDVPFGIYCFQSVLAHEVGHALGFTSAADVRADDMDMLDIYRFQRQEGGGTDYNPDNSAEFSTTARLVDFNAPLNNDDSNSDLITAEYQMSDGNPYQASHFTERTPTIYRMDPATASGETGYPNFYRIADLAMLDAIGWNFPPENSSCPQAVPLSCGGVVSFDTSTNNLAPNPSLSCGDGTAHRGSLWFSFVATGESAQVTTCGSDGDDSTLAVYQGGCNELNEIACSEDGGCEAKPGLSSICFSNLNAGQTYYVQVSSRTPAAQRTYLLQVNCSCLGACCLTPPSHCLSLSGDECAAVGGRYAGPLTECIGDLNGDGRDDTCEQPRTAFSQLPTIGAEDSASNVDATDSSPSWTVTDEFTSDGRPVHSVRWWGSVLDPGVQPDGWLLSFHERLVASAPAAAPLGLYFCDASVVDVLNTPIPACDAHAVIGYEARLDDCCLVSTAADSRSDATPAAREAFFEELCLDYDLGVQAIAGVRYDRDLQTGQCLASATANTASGDFWGWHRTLTEHGVRPALAGPVTTSGGNWLFGPLGPLVAACGPVHAAFELVTTTPGGEAARLEWDNGLPNNTDQLGSQYGGDRTDWLTVDDLEIANGGTLHDLHWFNEEQAAFVWAGRVRLEIYPDSGSLSPDESGGAFVALWVPDEGGSVSRTDVGPGQVDQRYRYDATGLNVALPPGRWWIGLATAGETGGTGQAFWSSSHSLPGDILFLGGEAHLRAPSAGIPAFQPWSAFLNGRQSDVAFTLTTPVFVDCNCNGIADHEDVLAATSPDCNGNGIPDECDDDCNENGTPDDCDLVNQTATDCQGNGRPDACDIFLGLSADANGNLIPDECCEPADSPTPELSPLPKNRVITLNPGNPGRRTALRVKLVSLQHPDPPNSPNNPPRDFSAYENTYRWIGPPASFPETTSPLPTFTAAKLQCYPFFMDWSPLDVLHVYGAEIIPSSFYEVFAVEEACFETGQLNPFVAPLQVTTARWGDLTAEFQPPSESPQPDGVDVISAVNKFKGLANAPIKALTKLQPSVPDLAGQLDALDIVACVDSFRGLPYPYSGITACPP